MPVKLQAGREVSWDEVAEMAEKLAAKLLEGDAFDIVVGMETGGAYVAAMLKRMLNIPHMVALDVAARDGDYWLNGIGRLHPKSIRGMNVLCVDDGFNRGILLHELVEQVRGYGATAQPAAIIRIGSRAEEAGRLGDAIAVQHVSKNFSWPWKRLNQLC